MWYLVQQLVTPAGERHGGDRMTAGHPGSQRFIISALNYETKSYNL